MVGVARAAHVLASLPPAPSARVPSPALSCSRGRVARSTAPQVSADEQNSIGMVVIRGNSIVMIEAMESLER